MISPNVCPREKKTLKKNDSKDGIPKIDAMTMIKSNRFHGIVKYLTFNATSFIAHSIVNLNRNKKYQEDFPSHGQPDL